MSVIRILIVEDHPIVREGIQSLISVEPDMSVVGCASSGKESIDLFRSLDPNLTVLDLTLPDMDGTEAIGAIRGFNPKARILVLSALQREQDVLRAVRAGANGYLFKSAASTELVGAIRLVARGNSYLPTDIITRAVTTPPVDELTPRELQILKRIAAGEDNATIAAVLRIDPGTVKNHVHHLLSKLGARTRTHAVAVAMQRGLVRPPGA